MYGQNRTWRAEADMSKRREEGVPCLFSEVCLRWCWLNRVLALRFYRVLGSCYCDEVGALADERSRPSSAPSILNEKPELEGHWDVFTATLGLIRPWKCHTVLNYLYPCPSCAMYMCVHHCACSGEWGRVCGSPCMCCEPWLCVGV